MSTLASGPEARSDRVADAAADSVAQQATESLAGAAVLDAPVDARSGAATKSSPVAGLRSRLDGRLRRFGDAGRGTLLLTVPAPAVAPETFLDLARLPEAFLWQAPEGVGYAGHGAVHTLRAAGGDRFASLRELAETVLGDVVAESADGAERCEARLWGGLAFDEGAADGSPWSSFGDAQLFLPRFLYRVGPGGRRPNESASLTLAATAAESSDAAARGRLLDQMDVLLAELSRRSAAPEARSSQPATAAAAPANPAAEADDEAWIRRVDEIRRAISGGEVEKIVAARRFRVPVSPDLSISTVLRRLGRGLRSSTRFAFRHRTAAGDVTFLGATPERLVSKRGARLETEALAGTMEAGGEHAAELLESGKNRHEQQLVTDSIVRRLRPLCAELEVAERPTVRELRDILHLHTPIRGVLEGDRHVLELVQALHPTPAVGGVPTPEALRWIAERETHPRGWYAAPIGWLDARGDGEFYVALRSCLVAGGEAFLYAGAGIVADSDPVAEVRETELKTHALRKALGS